MQVHVHHDNHIEGSDRLRQHVESLVEGTLGRFGEQITRVEVHLNDENSSHKTGDDDKRCMMEARLAGLQPIAVTHHGATIDQALDGAVDKLERALDHKLGRLSDRH